MLKNLVYNSVLLNIREIHVCFFLNRNIPEHIGTRSKTQKRAPSHLTLTTRPSPAVWGCGKPGAVEWELGGPRPSHLAPSTTRNKVIKPQHLPTLQYLQESHIFPTCNTTKLLRTHRALDRSPAPHWPRHAMYLLYTYTFACSAPATGSSHSELINN